MKAITIQGHGGPEQLVIQELAVPGPLPGQALIQVKAFGINHAESPTRPTENWSCEFKSFFDCESRLSIPDLNRLSPQVSARTPVQVREP